MSSYQFIVSCYMMHLALRATNLDRLITLLSMLKMLAETQEVETIASAQSFIRLTNQR